RRATFGPARSRGRDGAAPVSKEVRGAGLSGPRGQHGPGRSGAHRRPWPPLLTVDKKEERERMKRLNGIVAVGLAVVFALMANVGTALAAAKAAPTSKVNVNTATAEQFAVLPGVGPKLGARIVEYRQKSGGSFKSVQELMNVRGIGEKNFAKLQPHPTTGEAAPARTGR